MNDDVTTSPAPVSRSQRFAWLDVARGAALLAMASYHFLWDLADFGYLAADFPSTGWPRIYARAIATTFLVLAGISLVLAHGSGIRWRSFGLRFAKIAAAALLVTAGTYIAIPQAFIFFGILHAMAAASLVGLLFLRVPPLLTAIAAIAAIAAPNYLRSELFDTPFLWWVGLGSRPPVSFDYVPLLPWLGPFLLGMAAARLGSGWLALRQNRLGISATNPVKTVLIFLGRHSLVFYLLHQPVLIAMLYTFSLAMPAPRVAPETRYIESCTKTCRDGASPDFCSRFCGCTLEKLQGLGLLERLQSGAISVDNDQRINGIAMQCTSEAE